MLSLIPGLIQCPLIDCSQSQNLSRPTNCEILRPLSLSLLQNTETQVKPITANTPIVCLDYQGAALSCFHPVTGTNLSTAPTTLAVKN